MTKYIQQGSTFRVTSDADMVVTETLPANTYTVRCTDQGEFYLSVVDNYQPLSKVYGDTLEMASRILNTFDDRAKKSAISTGVLLVGEKGTGKSLLAKYLSITGISKGYPTIVINNAWRGDNFNKFIQSINQPCVVLFDEFEKIYDEEEGEQEELLTLLDGVYPTTKLFVLTSNSRHAISDYMLNRPGRLFYTLEYEGLDARFITEYCQENLLDTSHIQNIVSYSKAFMAFNFDMLKALVEEMNRYKETPDQALKMLNIKATSWSREFNFSVTINEQLAEPMEQEIRVDPMRGFNARFFIDNKAKTGRNGSELYVYPKHLIDFDGDSYTYKTTFRGKEAIVKLTPATSTTRSFNDWAMAA